VLNGGKKQPCIDQSREAGVQSVTLLGVIRSLGDGVRQGINPALHPWYPLSSLDFIVLVGVTGVGKTTTLEALRGAGFQYSLLPDRRLVTDVVMISAIAGQAVTDREERFALTAKYRELHPGGMAQAIGSLSINLEMLPAPLVFDGLRGLEEVSYAAEHYQKARFIVLDAPDAVRVQRLLGRSDAFDRVQTGHSSGSAMTQLEAINGVQDVFSTAQLEQLAALQLDANQIVAKTKIVVTERQNYDPVAARDFLARLPGQRVLYVDTTASSPQDIAGKIRAWL
jgi:energy-coupling factor transporter ATP-binding protein EcfA2